jgi:hypothetical protein
MTRHSSTLSILLLTMAGGVLFLLSTPPIVQAVCPICTIAVGAGLGISRWLGIDDAITGLWIGGLVTSSNMWFISWLEGKGIKSKLWRRAVGLLSYLLLILTLYLFKIAGNPLNTLWGIDKIVLGIVFGSVVFYLSVLTDRYIKKINNGQVLIYYQKVILPMLFLSIISFMYYLLAI